MIEVQGLTKRFGKKTVVDDLSFVVPDGVVTGFLGPNGSGKSTSMRCMLSLDRSQAGTTRYNGKRYEDLPHALREVGALLDAKYVHPSRTARNHLRYLAASNGLAKGRVEEVLAMVGMSEMANTRVGKFSLGMHQRLGMAAAMLGDPHTLLFDEPVNGLDPEGIVWVRNFMRYLASEGRAVLVSSHLLSEMAQTADHLVVIGQGKLISAGTVDKFITDNVSASVVVQSPQASSLATMLRGNGAEVVEHAGGSLAVSGVTAAQVGELAARHGVVLHELTTRTASLEEAFMEATRSSVEYRSAELPGSSPNGMPMWHSAPGTPETQPTFAPQPPQPSDVWRPAALPPLPPPPAPGLRGPGEPWQPPALPPPDGNPLPPPGAPS